MGQALMGREREQGQPHLGALFEETGGVAAGTLAVWQMRLGGAGTPAGWVRLGVAGVPAGQVRLRGEGSLAESSSS